MGELATASASPRSGTAQASVLAFIHPSAWKGNSANYFALTELSEGSAVQFYEVELGCAELSAPRRPPTMVSRYTASLKATTVCRTPVSQVSGASGPYERPAV
jgi:hypothetical protein